MDFVLRHHHRHGTEAVDDRADIGPYGGRGQQNRRFALHGEALEALADRANELLEDERHLVEILHAGADKARTVASATVAQSYKNLGLVL